MLLMKNLDLLSQVYELLHLILENLSVFLLNWKNFIYLTSVTWIFLINEALRAKAVYAISLEIYYKEYIIDYFKCMDYT